jgi:glutamate dehydrogenase/leucine dehydrogenase
MGTTIERAGPCSDYEARLVARDDAIGLHAIVVVHSTARGPAFGGIRRWRYPNEGAALADAVALATAMSRKCALADLPAGGAKTVMLRPAGAEPDWSACYRALGRVVESLGGRYVCGPDVGTGPVELDAVRALTRWVNPAPNDAGSSTAQGVLAGMRAVLELLELPDDPRTRVAIVGLGAVGLGVARGLLARGITVLGADVRPEACEEARIAGVEIVPVDTIMKVACDVLSPCALGGTLDLPTVETLRCRAICGSANNQLADDRAARRLAERGIVHAPDIVVSAGAVIEGVLTVRGGTHETVRQQVHASIERLHDVTRDVLERARTEGRAPHAVACERADQAIAAVTSSRA